MQGKSFRLPSFAKINLSLRVLGKRADSFHEICTVFQTVSLCDYVTFSESDRVVLTCHNEKIPTGDKNLIVKAAELLKETFAVEKGAAIHLEKHIPAPGGLGGGSSNAAAALFGLARLWEIEIDAKKLQSIGEKLGSDVPFFFSGGTALGTGRGEVISPLADFVEKHLLIVTPTVDVSTKNAFARLNAPDLTNNDSKSILQICRDAGNSPYSRRSELKNDFERVIFEIEPETRRVKEKLFAVGAKQALLCGSGASVFGVFETNEERQNALETLSGEQSWRAFPAETVSRLAYRNLLRLDRDFA